MQRRKFTSVAAAAVSLWSLGPTGAIAVEVSQGDAALGVRTALDRSATAAVGLLGRSGGFLDNPAVRIPLPGFLNDAARLLKLTGQQARVDELVTAMNRAAEAAVPEARALLINAVKSMSVGDARAIITGGDQSATQFFASKTRDALGASFLPIVTRATEKVALAEKYNAVAGKAAALGLMRKGDANIQQYVTGKALDGLFLTIGEQERQIRQNPVATGSAILRQVFSR